MNDSLVPETLDIRKAFTRESIIEGCWPVRRMSRLLGSLSSDEGMAQVRLAFARDADWRRIISGEVSATVQVTCERCLESFALSLREPIRLAVVESEGLAERLPEDIEPWLTDEESIRIPDVIEEQLILGMPIVVTHSDADCMPVEQKEALQRAADDASADSDRDNATNRDGNDRKDNPFAILETLKKTDR